MSTRGWRRCRAASCSPSIRRARSIACCGATASALRGAYCAWLDKWLFAQKAGDEAEAAAAVNVLLDAENWPAVREQAAEGTLDQDLRQYANTVADGYGDKAVFDQMQNCIEY